ncbi:MoxR-like ATPase [Amphibacillus marinus]|uniref:MoxR-like ATPase n=1 Tax=Amphibacillus marinus TaxID=872970 RepID=A0A1H8L7F8_9BACI|nr:MoxR family ATPase [Amphibacillus marinus]SEO01035.1 MoxR-like ATPase [Amphibacillus marinus]
MLEIKSSTHAVVENIQKVIIGKSEIAVLSLTTLLAKGHVLLEDVPGVGKTMLVRALAKSLNCAFSRIQFTPDLLPSDVTGVSIYHPQTQQFEYRKGPIVGDIILADEINRTSPKTQSSLLEAMEESSVTVDGETVKIDQPFFVMATQNPIEYEGTYPLPEAQLDRFLMKLNMGYPAEADELEMLRVMGDVHPIESLTAVLEKADVVKMQEEVDHVYVDPLVQQFIVQLVRATRKHSAVELGVSPRGSIALLRAAKAYAFIHGRDYVIPDDVTYLAQYVLGHRLILTHEAKYSKQNGALIIKDIMRQLDIPARKAFN